MKDPFDEVYKKCNRGTNQEKYDNIPDFPDVIDIELTNKCNLTCPMCPTGRKELTRKRGGMSKRIYSLIMNELDKTKTPVRFVRWGEPMMHPDFWAYIAVAKEIGLMVHVNTNGYFLDRESVVLFRNLGVDSVKISAHDVELKTMLAVSNLSDLSGTFRHVSFTSDEPCCFLPYPLDKVSHYKTFWKGSQYPRLPNCPEVFNKLSINWDGTVSACCSDYDDMMLVGDLKKNSIKEIWEGEGMRLYRKMIVNNKHWELPLCKNCFDLEEK
jgi:radical SAM protein with 4Fe4S-binding SPASM domain